MAVLWKFEWEDMCNVEIPIPHLDKQKEIVKEYKTIVNRIALNNQLIQKLEETAQAIYKQGLLIDMLLIIVEHWKVI